MSRFHTDLFCEGPADDVLCSICQDVLDEPLELPCRHTFCCVCIRSVGQNGPKECPLCRRQYQETDLKAPAVAFQNLLRNLKMRCQNEACDQIITLEEYCLHQARCDFGSVVCPHRDCEQQMYRKDVEQHKAVCEYRPVPCPYGCGDTVQHRDTDHHFYTSCIMGKRICYKCECVYLYQEREKHDCIRYLKGEIKAAHQDHQDRMNQMSEEIQQLKVENSVLREDLKSGTFCRCPKKSVASLTSPPRSARLRKSFDTGQDIDIDAILHGGLILVCNEDEDDLKCFNIEGRLLHQMPTTTGTNSLADIGGGQVIHCNSNMPLLQVLKVSAAGIREKDRKITDTCYDHLTALDSQTVAAAVAAYYPFGPMYQPRQRSIDLLSVRGHLIQSIGLNEDVDSLCSSRDGSLLYRAGGEIIKVDIATRTEVLRTKIPDTSFCGITTTMDGSILACDERNNSILMLDSGGKNMKILWTVPEGDKFELFTHISLFDNIVVCYTDNRVYVIELEY